MAEEIEDFLRVSPPVWPGKPLDLQPGDLTKFLPQGMGISTPMVMRPWDDITDAFTRPNYYAFQTPVLHPIRNAPLTEACGGVVYFDGASDPDKLAALLDLLQVRTRNREYAAFVARSGNPKEDRFLVQVRFMNKYALGGLYGALSPEEWTSFESQDLSIGEAVTRFIAHQEHEWSFDGPRSLRGTFGGDGDWAKERLAFGFLVENEYHQVYRVWSRAWLITK
jgi:hypothetical protein